MIDFKDVSDPGVVLAPASFAKWAEHSLNEAETSEKGIRELEPHKNHPLSDERYELLEKLVDAQLMHVNAAILFSALEVEASLNFHGVVQLRKFYGKNLEWLKPHQKLCAIVAIVEQKLVEESDEIHKVTERLFYARNKVAHPKTQAFDNWDELKADKDQSLVTARQSVADMKTFLRLFKEMLPHSLHSDMRDD